MVLAPAAALLLGAASVGAQLKAVRFAAVVDGSGTVTQRGVVLVSCDTILRVARPIWRKGRTSPSVPIVNSRMVPTLNSSEQEALLW